MARSVATTIVQAVNAQDTDNAFLVLLTLTHSSFATVRLVNNTVDVVSNGNTYTAFPFKIELPASTEDFQPIMTATVYNATIGLVNEVRTIAGSRERIAVRIDVVASSDLDNPVYTVSTFEITNAEYDDTIMTFDMAVDTLIAEGYPADSFSPPNFPGIF